MITNLRHLKRNHFFTGRLLTAEDLSAEQEYLREKSKRHNRYLHGFGVVFGLEVSKRSAEVVISEGLALDCRGNEIVVAEPARLLLPRPEDFGTTIFLTLEFVERETEPVPVSGGSGMENSRIQEASNALFTKGNANSAHRHVKGRWLACGQSHGLAIARLKFGSGQWRIDRRHRRPVIK